MRATPFTPGLRRALRVWVLGTLLVGATGGGGVHAQTPVGDAAAKAKFTVTLARFVQWPAPAATSPSATGTPTLRICVLHNSAAVGEAFASLEGQRVAGHVVAVAANPRDRGDCAMLFIDASVAQSSAQAVAAVAEGRALTLGAVDGFLSKGGMVELANVNDTLRFDVNLKALRAARLEVSSQVLRLARQVRD